MGRHENNDSFAVNIISEPTVTAENLSFITQVMANIKKYYSGYFPAKTTANLLAVASQAWGYKTITALDPSNQKLSDDMKNTLPRMNPDNPSCSGNGASAGGGFSISYLTQPTVVMDIMNCPLDAAGTPPHEFTHALQSSYIKTTHAIDANPACYGPSWLREGQAQAGNIMLSYWNSKDQSLTSFKNILNNMLNPSTKANYLQFLEDDDNADYQQYDIGGFASLYLIARSGFDKSMQVWQESARLEGQNCDGSNRMKYFAQAFQNIYGQSLTDFYNEVTPYLQWLYDNRLTFLLATDIKQQPGESKISLTENCHAYGVSAELQKQVGATWQDVVAAAGWVPAPCANSYLPYAYAHFDLPTTIRWKVYAPGAWEWYSQPVVFTP